MTITPVEFRQTLGRWPSGVTVVTMQDGDTVHGITVSAFSSLSLEPPLVGVAIAHKARSHGLLKRVPRYAVSILSADQSDLSEHFAGRPVALEEHPFEVFDELPVVRGAVAQIACTIEQRVEVGDHTIYVGRIDTSRLADGDPLAYHMGGYRQLS